MGTKNREEAAPTQLEAYVTLGGEGEVEFTEKKSVFIAHAAPVRSSEQACGYIKNIRAEYSDARHNVYAYMISAENSTRYSDDGEPQGTAGMPLLNVIKNGGFTDAVITVTRYFGGILLGASGLLRAYSTAASEAVKKAGIVKYERYAEFSLTCGYSDFQKLRSEFERLSVRTDSSSFGEGVTLCLAVKQSAYEDALRLISDATSGRAIVTPTGERYDR